MPIFTLTDEWLQEYLDGLDDNGDTIKIELYTDFARISKTKIKLQNILKHQDNTIVLMENQIDIVKRWLSDREVYKED